MTEPRRTALPALALSLALGTAAMADPVALVIDVEGTVSPSILPFQELEDGQVLELAAGARLVFSHYGACREVEAVGGEVEVTRAGFWALGGAVREQAVPCPLVVSEVSGAGEIRPAGVVLRSALGAAPVEIAVLGAGAEAPRARAGEAEIGTWQRSDAGQFGRVEPADFDEVFEIDLALPGDTPGEARSVTRRVRPGPGRLIVLRAD